MLQGRLESVALALMNIPISAWESQVVVLWEFSKNTSVMGTFFSRLLLSYTLVTKLGE